MVIANDMRLFGNKNIGTARTNLMVAGIPCCDQSFYIAYLYATAFWTEQPEVVYDFMRSTMLEFNIGEMPVNDGGRLIDYFSETRPLRAIVPVRQNLSARLEMGKADRARLASRLRSSFEIVIHAEGARIRDVC